MEARDKALDGLRGIAILLVLATHFLHLKASGPLSLWTHALARAGWIGVDLFFVLSGFLITRILVQLRAEPQRARTFYGRRALRILPAYYAYLGLSLLLIFSLVEDAAVLADARRHLPGLLLFGQNLGSAWLGEPALRELRHLWSLAVEEQFYLLWPWLVWWLKPAQLARACLGLLLFCWACKLALWLSGADALSIYYFTLTRMDGFAVGGFLAARLCQGELRLPRRYALAPVLAGLFLLAVFLSQRSLPHREQAGLGALLTSATPLLFGGLLYQTLLSPPQSWLRRALQVRWLGFFGRYSYGIYLVHFAAASLVLLLLRPRWPALFAGNLGALLLAACGVLVSVALALALHRLVEAPALRLKDRFGAARQLAPG